MQLGLAVVIAMGFLTGIAMSVVEDAMESMIVVVTANAIEIQ